MENISAQPPADLQPQDVSEVLAQSFVTSCTVLRSMDSQGGDPERVFVTAADTCTRDLMQCNNAESREAAAQCLRAAMAKQDL